MVEKLEQIDLSKIEATQETVKSAIVEKENKKEKVKIESESHLNTELKLNNEIKTKKLNLIEDLKRQWLIKEDEKSKSRDKIVNLFTRILSFQLVFIALIVILSAIQDNNFLVQESIIKVIAGSLVAEILGVFLIIAKYMFDNQNDKLLDIIEKIIGKY